MLNISQPYLKDIVILTHCACLVFKTSNESVLSQLSCVAMNVILEATEKHRKHSLTTVEAFIS